MKKIIIFILFSIFLCNFSYGIWNDKEIIVLNNFVRGASNTSGGNGTTIINNTYYINTTINNTYYLNNASSNFNASLYYNSSLSNATYRFKLTNNCSIGYYMNGEYANGTPVCAQDISGSGSSPLLPDNIYLWNDTTLHFNESLLNRTTNASIDLRVNQGFLTSILNTIYTGFTYVNNVVNGNWSDLEQRKLNTSDQRFNNSINIANLFSNDFHNIGGVDKVNTTTDIRNAQNYWNNTNLNVLLINATNGTFNNIFASNICYSNGSNCRTPITIIAFQNNDSYSIDGNYTYINGINATLLPSTNYTVDCVLRNDAAAATTGVQLRINTTGTPLNVSLIYMSLSSATAMETFLGTSLTSNAFADLGSSTTAQGLGWVYGNIDTGSSGSNVTFEVKSEVIGSQARVRKGSRCKYIPFGEIG